MIILTRIPIPPLLEDWLIQLESLEIVFWIGATWWFPLLESLHVVGATLMLGMLLMVDLRLMGIAGKTWSPYLLIKQQIPWAWAGFFLALVTGAGMFATNATGYAWNPAMQIKLLLLVLAGVNMAVFHWILAQRLTRWVPDKAETTVGMKLSGFCSLMLWVGVMLAGRWVGHIT